ncbi:PucR family transcriptional regulator [Paenibacillus hamazuiensis]|uniref:PucR family transcriptional regulator n=1 Tax=Paenibacillus hamazuiensis TaxID=2936508 RepID=UPI00200F38C9|nr:helix-turn-helix domain-containing protein [Paenibacillus hamazuiensis]
MHTEKDMFEAGFDSLEAVAEAINKAIGCPVTIEDPGHRLIAYSAHDAKADFARLATIVGRRVPEKVIAALWREGVIRRLHESDGPVRVAAIEDVGLGARVAMAIRKNDDILGYIWILDDERRLGDEELARLKTAAQAVKAKLVQLQQQRRKKEESRTDFLWQLLTGFLTSETAIREQADKLDIQLPASYYVWVIRFVSEIGDSLLQHIQYIGASVRHVRLIGHVVDNDQLILLAAPGAASSLKPDSPAPIRSFAEQIARSAGSVRFDAGGSSLRESYAAVEEGYQEALTVLQIKRQFPAETRHIYDYPGLGFYRFLPLILQEKQKRPMKNAAIEKLRTYDAEHNQCLLHTLDVFLSCDSNAKEAARLLHVHINTLTYRLKRISEVGEIDLTDMNQKVTLYIDLKTEQLGGR